MNESKLSKLGILAVTPTAKSIALSIGVTICSFMSLAAPAQSADSYSAGCKSYSAGDHKAAEIYFKEAVAAYPGAAVAHYQLANTEMVLHKRAEAKAEYTRCLQLNPVPAVALACQKMLLHLNNVGTSHSAATIASAQEPGSAAKTAESERELKKQEILRKADAEANAIRAETEKMISEGGAPGNQQLVRNRDTGEVHVGVTTAQAEAMREEANARADKVQIAGKDRALHL